MKFDRQCQLLCNTPEKPVSLTKEDTKTLMQRIKEEYHVHLLVFPRKILGNFFKTLNFLQIS